MFLSDPAHTPYDLHFRVGDTPVRVHPTFWLFSIFLGGNYLNLGVEYLLIWIVVEFVSILVHELGHVWMGKAFGSHGHIILYGFGGLAVGSNALHARGQRILVCFAGPFAGFGLLAAVLTIIATANPERFPAFLEVVKFYLGMPPGAFGADRETLREAVMILSGQTDQPLRDVAVCQLIFINLLWGVMNLLPVWPLDGGQISRDVCRGIFEGRGVRISLIISVAVAGLIAVNGVMASNGKPLIPYFPITGMFAAIMFGLLALESLMQLQRMNQSRRYWDDGSERDPEIWGR